MWTPRRITPRFLPATCRSRRFTWTLRTRSRSIICRTGPGRLRRRLSRKSKSLLLLRAWHEPCFDHYQNPHTQIGRVGHPKTSPPIRLSEKILLVGELTPYGLALVSSLGIG